MKHLERTVLVILITLALAIPLSVVAAGNSVLYPDVFVTNGVQNVDAPLAEPAVALLNVLGKAPMLLALSAGVGALLLYHGRRKDAFFAVAPVTIAQALNFALKNLLSSPRPTVDHVAVNEYASGFGFPSGHTMTTVVFVGSLAFILLRGVDCRWRRGLILSAAALVALAMGFSRVYVGAHWPSDVLGAYLWGTAFTAATVLAYRATRFGESRRAGR